MTDISFEQGRYRAHVAVAAPVFDPTAERVKDALLKATNNKLTEFQVYKEQAPEDWPADEREDLAPIGFASYWIEGIWVGDPGSIPQSTDLYQILWIKRVGKPKEEYEPKASAYEWIPVAGALLLLGVAFGVAVKGASR